MQPLSDEELLDEIRRRIDEKNSAIEELGRLSEELRATNDELLKSEAVKSEFVSNIRNEFINPISALLPLSKKLATASLSAQEVNRLGKIVYKEIFELNFQFANIFAAAEIEAGTLRPQIAQVDLGNQLQIVADKFAQAAQKKSIELIKSTTPQAATQINTDARWLSLILDNLVANAIEFAPNNTKVTLQVQLIEDLIYLKVVDSGQGIDPAHEKQLFKRFHQLSSGDTKQHKGSGLGLCVAADLAIMLGGNLRYQRLDKQTQFAFVVPADANQQTDVDDFAEDDFLFFDNPQKF